MGSGLGHANRNVNPPSKVIHKVHILDTYKALNELTLSIFGVINQYRLDVKPLIALPCPHSEFFNSYGPTSAQVLLAHADNHVVAENYIAFLS